MQITSVFDSQQAIPIKYTGEGQNISPALTFHGIPENAKSLVLIMDDPDAPHGVFDHWIVWNIPPTISNLSEEALELKKLSGVQYGKNGVGTDSYFGPKPPPGNPHRYFFKLYALDVSSLDLANGSSKHQVEVAMKGHIIDQAVLVGIYQFKMKQS